MGKNYLITPKEFNGTDYDFLYFKTISSQILLTENAKQSIGQQGANLTLDNALANTSYIEIVSYIGTGLSGENNPCSITFSVAPKVVFFVGSSRLTDIEIQGDNASKYIICTQTISTVYSQNAGFVKSAPFTSDFFYYGKKSADGKTFSWYIDTLNRSFYQLNDSGVTYYFMGIR